ncbi:hypothetical protein DRW07_06440 [Alteromonas sediminis]|uniref:Ribose-phosphate pyrophosphokinase n=1 Tax=Alteromonas sediminis TaxID=2259342 RepID=A0A3N5Y0X5_9ALTE|nr:hypothetical protein [Alteromonas sediminis]RPJ67172.1 hypothetical protein DRW07_06440 [Alteromonas sediminis]
MRFVLTTLICIVALAACEAKKKDDNAEQSDAMSSMPLADTEKASASSSGQDNVQVATQTHIGFIVYKSFEGGFYAFENNQGARFTLLGLEKQYRRDGLNVRIEGIPQPNVMTTTQFGIPFRLSHITVLEDNNAQHQSEK